MPHCLTLALVGTLALGLGVTGYTATPVPALTVAPVFTARQLGYDSTRIPALVRSDRGTLIAFCEGRSGPGGDWARINIIERRSQDDGNSWDDVQVVAKKHGRTGLEFHPDREKVMVGSFSSTNAATPVAMFANPKMTVPTGA